MARAVTVRVEQPGGPSAEFDNLQHGFGIPQVLQTLATRTVHLPENETKLVAQSEASALSVEKEQRQQQQS